MIRRLLSRLRSLFAFSPCHCGGERVEAGPVSGYIVCRKCGEVK